MHIHTPSTYFMTNFFLPNTTVEQSIFLLFLLGLLLHHFSSSLPSTYFETSPTGPMTQTRSLFYFALLRRNVSPQLPSAMQPHSGHDLMDTASQNIVGTTIKTPTPDSRSLWPSMHLLHCCFQRYHLSIMFYCFQKNRLYIFPKQIPLIVVQV